MGPIKQDSVSWTSSYWYEILSIGQHWIIVTRTHLTTISLQFPWLTNFLETWNTICPQSFAYRRKNSISGQKLSQTFADLLYQYHCCVVKSVPRHVTRLHHKWCLYVMHMHSSFNCWLSRSTELGIWGAFFIQEVWHETKLQRVKNLTPRTRVYAMFCS